MSNFVQTIFSRMKTTGEIIRTEREKKGMLLRQLAAQLDIDASILSKIERGERKASKEQILLVAGLLNLNKNEFLIHYLSEKIAYELTSEDDPKLVLKAAEERIDYIKLNKK